METSGLGKTVNFFDWNILKEQSVFNLLPISQLYCLTFYFSVTLSEGTSLCANNTIWISGTTWLQLPIPTPVRMQLTVIEGGVVVIFVFSDPVQASYDFIRFYANNYF